MCCPHARQAVLMYPGSFMPFSILPGGGIRRWAETGTHGGGWREDFEGVGGRGGRGRGGGEGAGWPVAVPSAARVPGLAGGGIREGGAGKPAGRSRSRGGAVEGAEVEGAGAGAVEVEAATIHA